MAHHVTFKFTLNQKVFFVKENRVQTGVIKRMGPLYVERVKSGHDVSISYFVRPIKENMMEGTKNIEIKERFLFATKEELLASL
jgi:hypothetical protein